MPASFSKPRATRPQTYLLLYSVLAAVLISAHGALLHLPFFWDELGQFIPQSLDLYREGRWITHSTLPNVHPPGLMAYLTGAWLLAGFSIEATRIAMLLLAAGGALCVFRLAVELARGTAGTPAFTAVAMLVVSPLFFAQSMLAQLDMPAMCFTALALLLFLRSRFVECAVACTVLVLVKETGIVAPAVFGAWLLWEKQPRKAALFILPLLAVLAWLGVLKHGTGHWFGNRQFTDYNVFYPLNPARLMVAVLRRIYYLFIGSGHFIGTAALVAAWRTVPLFRSRAWQVAGVFGIVHVLAVCALGGAVLERYLLPVLPLLYTAFAIALASLHTGRQRIALAGLLGCLVAANFVNPIYPFPFENNLAFVSFVELQLDAASAASLRPGVIATAFPMSDALLRPDGGFVSMPRKVIQLEGFRRRDLAALRLHRPDELIVFDTVWDPLHLLQWPLVHALMAKFYDYDPPLTADQIAEYIPMRVLRTHTHRGLTSSLLVR